MMSIWSRISTLSNTGLLVKLLLVSMQVVSAGLSFWAAVEIANKFGAAGLGVWSFTYGLIIIFSSFASLGFGSSAAVFIPILGQKERSYLIGSATLIMLVSCALVLVAFLTLNQGRILTTLAAALLPYALTQYFKSVLHSKAKNLAASFLGLLLPAIILVVASVVGSSLETVATIYLSGNLLLCLWIGWLAISRSAPKIVFIRWGEWRKLITRSAWMMFTSITQVLLKQTDIIIVGLFLTMSDVGAYSAAAKINLIVLFGLNAVLAALSSKISPLCQKGNLESLNHLLKWEIRVLTIFTSMPLVVIIALGPELLKVFGEGFEQGYIVLLLLAAANTINAFTGPVGLVANCLGYEKVSFLASITSLSVNVFLSIWLVNHYGAEGVAFATAVSVIIRNVGLSFYLYRSDRVKCFLN